jgi:hypothetical protein
MRLIELKKVVEKANNLLTNYTKPCYDRLRFL